MPTNTGEITYIYPKSFICFEAVTAIKAVAPPGGWRVLVICIQIIERETASGAEIQTISGTNLFTVTPIKAEIK